MEKESKSNKKIIIIIIGAVLGVLLIAAGGIAFYVGGIYSDFKKGICNVDVNGYSTRNMTYDSVAEYLVGHADYEVGELSIKEALDYHFGEAVSQLENVSFSEYMRRSGSAVNTNTRDLWEIDGEAFANIVKKYNRTAKQPKNPEYKIKNGEYKAVMGWDGNSIDGSKLLDCVRTKLSETGKLPDQEDLESTYIRATWSNEDMKTAVNQANKYLEWKAEYDNGNTYQLSPEKAVKIKNCKVKPNLSAVDELAEDIHSDYEKQNSTYSFRNHGKKTQKISGGTWTVQIDTEKEAKFLRKKFMALEDVKGRTPEYRRKEPDFSGKYIEVSLSEQHLWMHEGNKLVGESGIVSGKKGEHDTPTGLYYISERIPGKYLTGDGYKTWVNRWLRLTDQGVGLHDATWRSSFGGRIYEWNGSHGCINLPLQFAKRIFEWAEYGMPVIVY